MTQSQWVGFISTHFAGTDGVSLETARRATALQRMGHECFYFCGLCDCPPEVSHPISEAFYRHPTIAAIPQTVFTGMWGHRVENCQDCVKHTFELTRRQRLLLAGCFGETV